MKYFICNLFIILFIFCTSCIKTKPSEDSGNMNTELGDKIFQDKLLGKWYLNEWDLYHTLDFSDNEIVIHNHIDTTFQYQYELKGDSLIFSDSFNHKKYYVNQIFYINDEELVFINFMEKEGKQKYSRTKLK